MKIAGKPEKIFVGVLLLALFWAAGCTPALVPLTLDDTVIADTRVWSGEVRVRGLVTVKKGGQLTIEPGTKVVFAPFDDDGDGIGDGELLVEGSIIARGTAERPILFTSGAVKPQPADWKFVYVDFARQAEFDHAIFEYAFSGLQIHFCKARVTNSEFRHNIDGLRFSTVNLYAAGNRLHHNVHGVRYEERRSEALLHHNDIRDNQVGLFVVTRGEDRARFVHNNITANRQYDVKLGWQQPGPVTLAENWWGTIATDEIVHRFFDQRRDASLGLVTAPQPLAGPVDPADWQNFPGVVP
ncbi:MAG: right-handed parallel beta-helix repeat-containing protein [Desulfuromonadales bacterium]|nr:right-handed parallel beta-helix repeat-containing protein [Desulfuromonadales bacterium]